MKRSDTKIHQTELLLTLDYLLNHSDIMHPASKTDICRHAKNYGLTYNDGKAGDDVKRQRIAETLNFLEKVSAKFPDKVPFILEKTESGKFYIEEKNGLDVNQVVKLLCAINESKYFSNDETDLLCEKVLNAFSSSESTKELIKRDYEKTYLSAQKLDEETLRKIKLIEKAYKENRMIKVRWKTFNRKLQQYFYPVHWYKVYLIKEFNNKPYAFLLPIYKKDTQSAHNFIFDAIENILVAKGSSKEVLNYDDDENNDFNDFDKIFKDTNPVTAKKFGTLDNLLKKSLCIKGGNVRTVTFSFQLKYKNIIERSYRRFFNEEFRYQEIIPPSYKSQMANNQNEKDYLQENFENEKVKIPLIGYSNLMIDNQVFKSWALSDPLDEGVGCIADLIHIVKPKELREEIARYFMSHLYRTLKYLSDDAKKDIVDRIQKNIQTELKD